ncbi:MAG: hypothetical protein ACO36I_22470, partial [Candidatus Latescibacterota bacterium]
NKRRPKGRLLFDAKPKRVNGINVSHKNESGSDFGHQFGDLFQAHRLRRGRFRLVLYKSLIKLDLMADFAYF